MARRPLTGVLLVGGASRRFGSPKALVEVDGERLVDRGITLCGFVRNGRLNVYSEPWRVAR